VREKMAKFLRKPHPRTPSIQITLKDIVVKKLVENLNREGLKGEVASIPGH